MKIKNKIFISILLSFLTLLPWLTFAKNKPKDKALEYCDMSSDDLFLHMANYEKLEPEMKEAEVEKIIGCYGTEMSKTTFGNIETRVVQYKRYSAVIMVVYNSGRLFSKSQYGL